MLAHGQFGVRLLRVGGEPGARATGLRYGLRPDFWGSGETPAATEHVTILGLDGGRTLTPPILLGEVLMRNTCSILALGAVLAFPPTALAQDSSELLTRMRAMEDRIKALEAVTELLRPQP